MATKNLSRSIIEGGRTGSDKHQRKEMEKQIMEQELYDEDEELYDEEKEKEFANDCDELRDEDLRTMNLVQSYMKNT